MATGVTIGIDLGTTNSVAALSQNGQARVLAGADGAALVPSVVAFPAKGNVLVGRAAREQRFTNPENTIFSTKRLLGRSIRSEEVRMARTRFPFQMVEGPGEAVLVKTRAGDLALPEISAHVLRAVRDLAESALGETVLRAVITVPANFNELQRTATKLSGQIADMEVVRILNEPTAAALAYGYGRGTREKIAVYDFGGGTFDVTLLELSGNVFEVLATAGDTFLGGDDIDLALVDRFAEELEQNLRVEARADRRLFERLRASAETAKITLSTSDVAQVSIQDLGDQARGLSFQSRVTRRELEILTEPLLERTFDVCREALKLAGLSAQDFPAVILVGGTSRMPMVRERVGEFFNKAPLMTLPPEHAVALGASILAEALAGGASRMRAPSTATLPAQSAPVMRPRASTMGSDGQSSPGVADSMLEPSNARRPLPGPAGLGVPAPQRPRAPSTRAGLSALDEPTLEPSVRQTLPTGAGVRPASAGAGFFPQGAGTGGPASGDAIEIISTVSQLATLPGAPLHPGVAEMAQRKRSQPNLPAQNPNVAATNAANARAFEATMIAGTNSSPRIPAMPAPRMPTPPAGLASPVAVPTPAMGVDLPTQMGRAPVAPSSLGVSAPSKGAFSPSTWPGYDSPSTPQTPSAPAQQNAFAPAVLPSAQPVPLAPTMPGAPTPAPMPNTAPPLLLDVTPHSLGIETVGGVCEVIIPRNTTIPIEQSREFTTTHDNQELVLLRIAQGESKRFTDNQRLGELELSGIPRAARGEVQVRVTFELDASGTLRVRAKEVATGRETQTRVTLLTMGRA